MPQTDPVIGWWWESGSVCISFVADCPVRTQLCLFLSLFRIKWPQIPSTGSGRASAYMTTRRSGRRSEGRAQCAVFTSWTPGSLGPPTSGSTGGGKIVFTVIETFWEVYHITCSSSLTFIVTNHTTSSCVQRKHVNTGSVWSFTKHTHTPSDKTIMMSAGVRGSVWRELLDNVTHHTLWGETGTAGPQITAWCQHFSAFRACHTYGRS